MKHLVYFTVASLIFLSACDMELDPAKTDNKANNSPVIFDGETPVSTATAPTPIAIEPVSPYYALRPIDDKWPPFTENESFSENLLAANYYVVLDGSGSMEGDNCAMGSTKMAVAKNAVNQFAQQIPADANLALLTFDKKGASQRVALGGNNREQFNLQVNEIIPGSITPLKTVITYAYQQLQKQASKQLGYGEYHLVVVTDGIATANEVPDRMVQTILQDSPIVIHSIGFCIDEQHSLNQPGMTFYSAASNAEELQQGLQAVLAESPDFNSDHF